MFTDLCVDEIASKYSEICMSETGQALGEIPRTGSTFAEARDSVRTLLLSVILASSTD